MRSSVFGDVNARPVYNNFVEAFLEEFDDFKFNIGFVFDNEERFSSGDFEVP